MAKTKSGIFWVTWANAHAKNSTSVDDLVDPFKANAKAFIKALKDAGAMGTQGRQTFGQTAPGKAPFGNGLHL